MIKGSEKKASIFSKIIIIPILVLIALIIIALGKETYKKNQIQKEIDDLQEKARQIEKESVAIQDKISYLNSKDYQEKEARDKFNLQNPDEKVVVIRPSIAKEDPPEEKKFENIRIEEKEMVNPLKWWKYFFKN